MRCERGRSDLNIGEGNSGFYNIGDKNSGGFNVGLMNIGDYNVGDYNLGDGNTGCKNLGEWNSGDFNRGNYNTGDFNVCDNSSGIFCTEKTNISFFDGPSGWTLEQWKSSQPYNILKRIRSVKWIETNKGGYLVEMDFHASCKEFWCSLTQNEKNILMQMPNFDAKKFHTITGINVYDIMNK